MAKRLKPPKSDRTRPTFTVDTQIFRELGELLVGRASTALVELVKNSYDADATWVRLYGENLDDPDEGIIVIEDDGVGMDAKEFRTGFLRIASRIKTEGDRRSPLFRRRFTGEKGIGRLAAHKLARHMTIESCKWTGRPMRKDGTKPGRGVLGASIDWDEIERQETLDDLEGSDAIQIESSEETEGAAGTKITLSRLRSAWTNKEKKRFYRQIGTYFPPDQLTAPLPRTVFKDRGTFRRPKVMDFRSKDGNVFEFRPKGELEPAEAVESADVKSAIWVIEIDCNAANRKVVVSIIPSKPFMKEFPLARTERHEISHPQKRPDLSFHARILIRELKRWPPEQQGIRIYMEGFRVLPYGEPGDDWLDFDYDYTNRTEAVLGKFIDQGPFAGLTEAVDEKEGLAIPTTRQLFGAVFLTQARAPGIQMLVNREGFVDGRDIDTITKVVRGAVHLQTRLRRAASGEIKRERKEQAREIREAVEEAASEVLPSIHLVKAKAEVAIDLARGVKRDLAAGKVNKASTRNFNKALRAFESVYEVSEELSSEGAMLRILASAGVQMATFIHEINGMIEVGQRLVERLEAIRLTVSLDRMDQKRLSRTIKTAKDLQHRMVRSATYLIDVVSADSRRRRSRQYLHDRFDAGLRLVQSIAEKRNVKIINTIPEDLKSPAMFPAEVTMVFSNLLTNAVKAAKRNGRIRASGRETNEEIIVRIENTGRRVNFKMAERLFDPFVSTTKKVDATLGQGMGLGLTIVRSMLDEYGAEIHFVKPRGNFSTAIELRFPK